MNTSFASSRTVDAVEPFACYFPTWATPPIPSPEAFWYCAYNPGSNNTKALIPVGPDSAQLSPSFRQIIVTLLQIIATDP